MGDADILEYDTSRCILYHSDNKMRICMVKICGNITNHDEATKQNRLRKKNQIANIFKFSKILMLLSKNHNPSIRKTE